MTPTNAQQSYREARMTTTIESVIEQAGGTNPVASPVFWWLWQVRFLDHNGRPDARYGTSPADLLKRCERYLAAMRKKSGLA